MRCGAIRILGALLVWVGAAALPAAAPHDGAELLGTKAPDWDVSDWFNSQPLLLSQLRGRVVLVRWWTGPECPYCALSAPYLNAWYEKYRANGLMVIGFYHHKSAGPLSRKHVEQLVKQYGFTFPVAIDPRWRTLKRWWLDPSTRAQGRVPGGVEGLDGHDRTWTSVSFLIDQQGIIRDIHPGGSYTKDEADTMDSMIRQLLGPPRVERQ